MLKKKTILYITESANLGGAEISLLEIIITLDKERFLPLVVCSEKGHLTEKLIKLGIKVSIIPLEKARQICFWKFLSSISELVKFIKTNNVDLVHANSTRANILAGFASRICSVPIIWHVRNVVAKGIYMDLEKYFTWLANMIIVNSNATKQRFFANLKKIVVVYNGVDLERFSPKINTEHIRSEFNLSATTRIVAVVGRLGPGKGQDFFLKAASLLKQEVANVKYLIVGDACHKQDIPLAESLKKLAQSLNVEQEVIFTGFFDDVAPIMASIDILVCPSSITGESFGRVLIEAMACEKPVIVTKAGAASEVIENNVTGILIPMRDSVSLAQAITFLLENEALASKMGQAGRMRVAERFDLKQTTKQIENIYLNLLPG